MAIDFILTHAREFTNIEVEGLTLWNELQDIGQQQLARDLLDAVLMAEHYTSLLPNNIAERTPDQLATLARLRQMMDALMDAARQAIAAAGAAPPAATSITRQGTMPGGGEGRP